MLLPSKSLCINSIKQALILVWLNDLTYVHVGIEETSVSIILILGLALVALLLGVHDEGSISIAIVVRSTVIDPRHAACTLILAFWN